MEGLPYVGIGDGPENLVVLPGITLHNRPPGRLVAQAHRLGFRRFAKGYTIDQIDRTTNMPRVPPPLLREMAAKMPPAVARIYRGVGHGAYLRPAGAEPEREYRAARVRWGWIRPST